MAAAAAEIEEAGGAAAFVDRCAGSRDLVR